MSSQFAQLNFKRPAVLFAFGWFMLSASYFHPMGMPWETFIHFWRVETAASIFLLVAIGYLWFITPNYNVLRNVSSLEFRLLIFPIGALIIWSLASMAWANSARSALHHALLWLVYLVFFLLVRQAVSSRRGIRSILLALLVVMAVYSISAISQYLSYFFIGGRLNTGINFQRYGEQVTALMPLVLVVCLRQNGRKFVVGILAVAALWILVLCGLGRMNLLLFAVGVVGATALTVWSKRIENYQRKLAAVFFVLISVPVGFWLLPNNSGSGGVVIASRLSENEGATSSNDFRRLMATISFEMFRQNPIFGVGADNFGYELNKYRHEYASRNPDDANLAQAESEIPERAHNELLQIMAELGLVGGLIIFWLLGGVGYTAVSAWKNRTTSPERTAAIFGVVIFLLSSLVTSFSFRLVQNGFVFFFLLAVSSRYFLSEKGTKNTRRSATIGPSKTYLAMGAACLSLLLFSLLRVSSVVVAEQGAFETDIEKAESKFNVAVDLDPENPNAYYGWGMRLFSGARYTEAAHNLRSSVDLGRGTSTDYSYLASAWSLAGNHIEAADAVKEALTLYPRSVFLRVRYASLLEAAGDFEEAGSHLHTAQQQDRRATNTWWVLINRGSRAATEASYGNTDFAQVMDLRPQSAVYAILAERDIRFPGEREKVPF